MKAKVSKIPRNPKAKTSGCCLFYVAKYFNSQFNYKNYVSYGLYIYLRSKAQQ